MIVIRWIEAHFWAFLLLAMLFGLLVPLPTAMMLPLLKPELMIVLLLVFLKIDILDILEKIRNYRLMIWLSLSFLVLSPILLYGLFFFWDAQFAVAVLLLTAVPAGNSSPFLTDLMGGNTTLAMSITILTSLLAPFTIPLLFHFLVGQEIMLDSWSLFLNTASMIFIPLFLSILLKAFAPAAIKKVMPAFSTINLVLLFLIVVSSFGSQRTTLLADPLRLLWDLFLMYFASLIIHLVGFLISWKQSKKDRVAIVIERAYMNTGLAIVLAATSFPPAILILMVIAEVPWSTTLFPLRWLFRKMNWLPAR
jgi:BASS family bile acid:Na+ symporter